MVNADTDIEAWHLPHMNHQPNDAMKPSHTTTPRQLADCTFVTGHSTISAVERRGHSAVLVFSTMGLCVLAGLLIAGVL